MAEASLVHTAWSSISADITTFLTYSWTPCCRHIHAMVRNRGRANSELVPRVSQSYKKPSNTPQSSWPSVSSYNKTPHPCHLCVGVDAPLKYSRCWRWLTKRTGLSIIVRISHYLSLYHHLFSCIIVHKSFFLSFCSFFFSPLEFVWSLILPSVPWLAFWLWAVCRSRWDILLSYTPDTVRYKICSHSSGHPLAPKSVSDPSSNKILPFTSSLSGFSPFLATALHWTQLIHWGMLPISKSGISLVLY